MTKSSKLDWDNYEFLEEHAKHLGYAVKWFETRLRPHDTGHIHTTINTLEERVQEINKRIEDNKLDEPIDAHDG